MWSFRAWKTNKQTKPKRGKCHRHRWNLEIGFFNFFSSPRSSLSSLPAQWGHILIRLWQDWVNENHPLLPHSLSLSFTSIFFLHQCPKIPLKPISGFNFTYSKLIILWWIGIGRRWGRQGEDQRGGQWKEQRNLSRVLGGRAKLSLSPQSLCHSPASSLSSLSVCSHFLPVLFFSSSRSVYPSAVAQFVKCP